GTDPDRGRRRHRGSGDRAAARAWGAGAAVRHRLVSPTDGPGCGVPQRPVGRDAAGRAATGAAVAATYGVVPPPDGVLVSAADERRGAAPRHARGSARPGWGVVVAAAAVGEPSGAGGGCVQAGAACCGRVCGLAVPDTLVTSEPAAVHRFV